MIAKLQCLLVLLLAPVLLLSFSGCENTQWQEIVYEPDIYSADIPLALRQNNWVDRNNSGSCVIASSIPVLRWHSQDAVADYFRKNYAGGQTASSIKAIWTRHKIPFEVEEDGRPEFLQWCSDTRRPAIIWFYTSHCVTFIGFGTWKGEEVAWLLDNNRIQSYIPVERNSFIRAWRVQFGGFAMATTLMPCPPLPRQGYEVIE